MAQCGVHYKSILEICATVFSFPTVYIVWRR